ncbi:MAG TPA: cysteate synthase [Gemmatimonadales bacterium]|nr:cysteate synthase [Gemmatimonadales bacterium]
MAARHYTVKCLACGRALDEDGAVLACAGAHEPAFLSPEYHVRRLQPDPGAQGLFRYRHWLPVERVLSGAGESITYRSERLGRAIGLDQLWVLFNGYWPERGATLDTATFKELEAWTVLARRQLGDSRILVVASAGNTAAAFARACSRTGIPCVIVVPESALPSLEFPEPLHPCVRIITVGAGADYSDATLMAGWIAGLPGFVPEGGVKNIARRAGLGTTLLAAVEAIGRLPDYYFQAVGSGAGAIGVHESAERLILDGRYGSRVPRLMLSQNHPFTPLVEAWRSGQRKLVSVDPSEGKRRIGQITAKVLANREPPFAIRGGVFDVLTASEGDMLVADNSAVDSARRLFEECEEIDIDPAGAVALATLREAVAAGRLARDAVVALNVTGGGRERRRLDWPLRQARPVLEVCPATRRDELLELVAAL